MPAIRVENLGKRYRLNHAVNRASYRTLRETLADLATAPWRRFKNGAYAGRTEEFWALKDVSFDVEPGEVVGVIGRNGAGKSTLLKILSRITKPTTGQASIYGRVSSLLEVGTGFNSELTGRENIYLSGAILGMGRREIDRKFDEIVDFAGVERFIDTPVKRYSSGMTVRLGFAVAAHLEPEILIVDEVLAVGDMEFQKRCLGKMQDVSGQGRTVLFVSHNMNAVAQLCGRCMLLEAGRTVAEGNTSDVIDAYLERGKDTGNGKTVATWPRPDGQQPFYTDITVNGTPLPGEVIIAPKDPLTITLHGDPRGRRFRQFRAGVHISSRDGVRLMSYATAHTLADTLEVDCPVELRCDIDSVPLLPGDYFIDVNCGNGKDRLEWLENIGILRVKPDAEAWRGRIPNYRANGYFAGDASWHLLINGTHSS